MDIRFDEISKACQAAEDTYRRTHATLTADASNIQLSELLSGTDKARALAELRKRDEQAQEAKWDAILAAVDGEVTHIVRGAFDTIVYAGSLDACIEALDTRCRGCVCESLCPLHHRMVWDAVAGRVKTAGGGL